ncbi:MAG: hypothetical protein ABIA59_01485 [Candidatus Latescibacterota bacterium]
MRFWVAVCLVSIFAIAACSDKEQPADTRARVHFDEDSLVSHQWVHIIIDDDKTAWSFGPGDLMMSPIDTSLFTTPEVQTQADGILTVTFRLITEQDSLFCDGSITAPLSPNWKWSFELVRAPAVPQVSCDDCLKVSAFDIYDPAFADQAIFLLWRGGGP